MLKYKNIADFQNCESLVKIHNIKMQRSYSGITLFGKYSIKRNMY